MCILIEPPDLGVRQTLPRTPRLRAVSFFRNTLRVRRAVTTRVRESGARRSSRRFCRHLPATRRGLARSPQRPGVLCQRRGMPVKPLNHEGLLTPNAPRPVKWSLPSPAAVAFGVYAGDVAGVLGSRLTPGGPSQIPYRTHEPRAGISLGGTVEVGPAEANWHRHRRRRMTGSPCR